MSLLRRVASNARAALSWGRVPITVDVEVLRMEGLTPTSIRFVSNVTDGTAEVAKVHRVHGRRRGYLVTSPGLAAPQTYRIRRAAVERALRAMHS